MQILVEVAKHMFVLAFERKMEISVEVKLVFLYLYLLNLLHTVIIICIITLIYT